MLELRLDSPPVDTGSCLDCGYMFHGEEYLERHLLSMEEPVLGTVERDGLSCQSCNLHWCVRHVDLAIEEIVRS